MRTGNSWLVLVGLSLIAACGSGSVNDTIRIADGDVHDGGVRSVNGNIIVGTGAVIKGDINSVNGMVDVDDEAEAGDIKTVNGSIRLGRGARTGNIDSVNGGLRARASSGTGRIRLVNGSIDTEAGTAIDGDIDLVNGTAELRGTRVSGDIVTYSGRITLTDASEAMQNIVIKKPKGAFSTSDKPRVVVGPDSRVAGKIIAEREISLYVHESASIGGVEGADPQPWADSPEALD